MPVVARSLCLSLAMIAANTCLALPAGAADRPPASGLPGEPRAPPGSLQASPVGEPAWRDRTSTVCLNLGLGSAIGELGLTYAFAPWMPLETELGIGNGLTGTQLSLMEKVVLGHGRTRVVAGVGVAYSPRRGPSWELRTSHWWLNLDLVGFEMRTQRHLTFSFAFGMSLILGPPILLFDSDCSGDQCDHEKTDGFPQLRFAIGPWF
jgi:hypothetical protein